MAQYSGYVGFGGPQYAPQPGQFGYAAPPSVYQQAPAQFSGAQSAFGAAAPAAAQSGFGAAAPAGAGFAVAAPAAQGFSNRVAAPASIQALYRGKPAFYDAGRGIYFDGRTAFYDAPQGASQFQQQGAAFGQQQQAFGVQQGFAAGQQQGFAGQQQFAGQQAFPASASASTFTAVENPHVVLGNGTAGNLKEHANALSSQYAFDYAPQYYL
uniref:Cuticular protein n=1 Tax=Panagrellus redivivus TaxID=6233 RepID=A0A7E4VF64_PANRE